MGRPRKASPLGSAQKVAAEVFAASRKPTKDSLIVHCLGRAYLEAHGWEKSQEQETPGAFRVNQWKAARVAPRATRVALFIASWAAAMRSEGREEYTITEYARFWNEPERTAYRLQEEFRQLWPEYSESNPNELARAIAEQVTPATDEAGRPVPYPVSVEVTA